MFSLQFSYEVSEGGSYEIKESLFKRYSSLMNKYIDNVPDREAQALFSIQSLVHSLDHPPSKFLCLQAMLALMVQPAISV